jgi:hypothetical protein
MDEAVISTWWLTSSIKLRAQVHFFAHHCTFEGKKEWQVLLTLIVVIWTIKHFLMKGTLLFAN